MKENKIYEVLHDGTVIDDNFISETITKFDNAIKNGTAKIIENPHCKQGLKVSFNSLPGYLQKELKPFIANV